MAEAETQFTLWDKILAGTGQCHVCDALLWRDTGNDSSRNLRNGFCARCGTNILIEVIREQHALNTSLQTKIGEQSELIIAQNAALSKLREELTALFSHHMYLYA